jgi:thiol-disulfide isomerase/thioredoxin
MKGIVWGVIALCILLVGIVGVVSADTSSLSNSYNISCDNAAKIAMNFINGRINGATYQSCTDLGQIFKIDINYNNQQISSYITQDGQYFGSQIIRLNYGTDIIDGNTAEKLVEDYQNKIINGITYDSYKDLGNLYEIMASYNGQKIPLYVTKDGQYEVMNVNPTANDEFINPIANNSQPSNQVPKSDKPKVELFVMSYCPYGLQMEKAIIPVYNGLGDKIDGRIRFVQSIHGANEDTEDYRQLCIREEQGDKYLSYLSCFTKSGKADDCMNVAGVDSTKVQNCMTNNAKNYYDADMQNAKDYGTSASPTLFINGVEVVTSRDSASILKAICDSFNNAPTECSTLKLSSKQPSTGFDYTTPTTHCGKLIYFCSDNSPYCNMTAPIIDQFESSSDKGCIKVTKHILADFTKLSQDPLALEYNVQGVPTFIFIDDDTGCFSDIGYGGGTKVTDLKNNIAGFKCSNSPQDCPSYVCDNGFKPKCSILNGQCSCESCPAKITPNQSSCPIDVPPINDENNNSQSIVNPIVCQGCQLDTKCYPFGFRMDKTYCDANSSSFINQQTSNSICNNNFECDSNLCINSQCVSGNLWAKIMDWFSHLFGGK